MVCNSIYSTVAGNSSIITAKIVPSTINFDPSTLENTSNCVVIMVIHLEESSTGIVHIPTLRTYKLTIHKLIGMCRSRNGCAPINYRLAIFAIGSAGITGFCTGSCLVVKHNNIVRMICGSTACSLNRCGNRCFKRSERTYKITCCVYSICVFDLACFYIIYNVDNRITITVNSNIVRPNSYGNGCYYC